MAAICVYCSSSEAIDPVYRALAVAVGMRIAADGHSLVSGGGRVSMMGAVARAARGGGAHTTGVIPAHLMPLEVADTDADELIVVDTMRERKKIMDERSDAFLALPGGLGTLEELLEIWVAATIGLHTKPVVVLDPTGVLAPLHELVERLTAQGFVRPEAARAVVWERDVADALDALEAGFGGPPLSRSRPEPGEVVEELLEAEP
jgi:uncharacterized protein (TIGR00730 family)